MKQIPVICTKCERRTGVMTQGAVGRACGAGNCDGLLKLNFRGGIYVASKTKHGPMWLYLRDGPEHLPIVSSWIDEWEPGATQSYLSLWQKNVFQAANAKVLIAYRQPDEHLKGALVEIGAALGQGRSVILVGAWSAEDGHSFIAHHQCRLEPTIESAIKHARLLLSGD